MGGNSNGSPRKEGIIYRMAFIWAFVAACLLLLLLAICICWCHCPSCSNSRNPDENVAGSFNNIPWTEQDSLPDQDSASPPKPELQMEPVVEETQGNERRTLNSVFEPDPNVSATNQTTPITLVIYQNCQVPNVTTQSYGSLSDSYNVQSNTKELKQGNHSSIPQNFSRACNTTDHNHNLPRSRSPEEDNQLPNFYLPANFLPERLPTIPEHPLTLNSNTTRKLSDETLQTPSALPDLNGPSTSTSSMPDLGVPSTSFAPYFASGNGSRLLFYRNTDINMCDIQNFNPELGVSNDSSLNLNPVDSDDSMGSEKFFEFECIMLPKCDNSDEKN